MHDDKIQTSDETGLFRYKTISSASMHMYTPKMRKRFRGKTTCYIKFHTFKILRAPGYFQANACLASDQLINRQLEPGSIPACDAGKNLDY